MAKTKAEVARMVASAAMKKYKNYSAIQLGRELNRLMALEKKQTTPANKIRIRVVKKLASKVDDKEISATEARQSLRKKVPAKKKVSKADFEKARKDLKDKKVSKPAPKKKKDVIKPQPEGKMIDLDREPGFPPQKVNSANLVRPTRMKKGTKFTVKRDAGYSSHISPYVSTAEYQSAKLFTTDEEGVTFKKFTAKEKKDKKFSKRLEDFGDAPEKEQLLKIGEFYLDAEKGSEAYKEARQMVNPIFSRYRFTVDYKNKQIIQVL
jgi:hypothetical protein